MATKTCVVCGGPVEEAGRKGNTHSDCEARVREHAVDLLEVLRSMESFFAFGDPLEPGDFGISDVAPLNVVFEQAQAALRKVEAR